MPSIRRNEHGLTFKEDKFCLRYVQHGIEGRAYAESFNVSNKRGHWIYKEAYRLLQRPEIQQRVRQLHRQLEESAIYGHREAMLEAHEAYIMAKEMGDPRGMSAAVMLKSKLSGLIIERSMDVRANIGNLSSDELANERQRINEQLRELGHAPLPALGLSRAGDTGPRTITVKPTEVHRERVEAD